MTSGIAAIGGNYERYMAKFSVRFIDIVHDLNMKWNMFHFDETVGTGDRKNLSDNILNKWHKKSGRGF